MRRRETLHLPLSELDRMASALGLSQNVRRQQPSYIEKPLIRPYQGKEALKACSSSFVFSMQAVAMFQDP